MNRILSYAIGVPLIAMLDAFLCLRSVGNAFAGAPGGGWFVFWGSPLLFVLCNNTVYNLLPNLSDGQVTVIIVGLNGILWGFVLVTVGLAIYKRMMKHLSTPFSVRR